MQTLMLTYDVEGRICPVGIKREDCALRKSLSNWENKFKIGYRVLENGNLLVPHFWANGNEPGSLNFKIKEVKETLCNNCMAENRIKEREDVEKGKHGIRITTMLCPYVLSGCNCPKGMNEANCPLRSHLAKAEEELYIGYKVLENNVLLIPSNYYNPKTNIYRNISREVSDICYMCFCKTVKNSK